MEQLIERVLLFTISILMFRGNQVDIKFVSLILVVFICECLIVTYGEKIIKYVFIFSLIALLVYPEVIAFYPLLVYELALRSVPSWIFVIVAFIGNGIILKQGLITNENILFTLFVAISILMGIRDKRHRELLDLVHNLQDNESGLKIKSIEERERLIKNTDTEIYAATLRERNRIAREIHDHVGHMISRAILQLGAIMAVNKDDNQGEMLKGLKNSLDTAMNNIRESVHDLKDESLDLQYMVTEISKEYSNLEITIDYDMSKYLIKELKYCIIAIIKEALTNTVKHSNATKVVIVMREHPGMYQVLIHDNGKVDKGNSKGLLKPTEGIGLYNMRERVSTFNGNISFSNNDGFKIFITIPKKD